MTIDVIASVSEAISRGYSGDCHVGPLGLLAMTTEMEPAYKINLELFEGPLDLLLHLIRKNDLSISDIPITLILDQYISYLDMLKELDVDVAGEFILMAAELAHIKSRLLIAKDDEDPEEPDPRADLVARLKVYEQFKRAAVYLNGLPLLNRDVFKKPPMSPTEEELGEEKELFMEVTPFALLNIFYEILKKAPKQTMQEIEGEKISVSERIYQILEKLGGDETTRFEALFEEMTQRGDIVITFLAILEMARLKMIRLIQVDRYGTICLQRLMETSIGEIQEL